MADNEYIYYACFQQGGSYIGKAKVPGKNIPDEIKRIHLKWKGLFDDQEGDLPETLSKKYRDAAWDIDWYLYCKDNGGCSPENQRNFFTKWTYQDAQKIQMQILETYPNFVNKHLNQQSQINNTIALEQWNLLKEITNQPDYEIVEALCISLNPLYENKTETDLSNKQIDFMQKVQLGTNPFSKENFARSLESFRRHALEALGGNIYVTVEEKNGGIKSATIDRWLKRVAKKELNKSLISENRKININDNDARRIRGVIAQVVLEAVIDVYKIRLKKATSQLYKDLFSDMINKLNNINLNERKLTFNSLKQLIEEYTQEISQARSTNGNYPLFSNDMLIEMIRRNWEAWWNEAKSQNLFQQIFNNGDTIYDNRTGI